MENTTRVSVFESDVQAEIMLIKSKLQEVGIESEVQNKYMMFTTTPTANSLQLMVTLKDEAKAFEIIDAWLKENQN